MENFTLSTKVCNLKITTENDVVVSIETTTSKKLAPKSQFQKNVSSQLEEYFNGKRKVFDFKINPKGTTFQKQVWQVLLTIPYSKTFSYKQVAEKLGRASSCRAVGNAIGKNPILVVIPCHRVIASSGGLGGFSGGLELKKSLLAIEKN